MVLPLPVELNELLLHGGDGSLQLSSIGCEEVVVDEMGVGTEGGEERQVGLTGGRGGERGEGRGRGREEGQYESCEE